jgi:hypothetical protein
MQSAGAIIAVHDTVSTVSCFFTKFGLEVMEIM